MAYLSDPDDADVFDDIDSIIVNERVDEEGKRTRELSVSDEDYGSRWFEKFLSKLKRN